MSIPSPSGDTSWLLANWGNLASVLGLLISVWVLIVSRRAQKAVDDLKDAFGRRSLAQELRDCGDDVNLVNVLGDSGKWDLASTTCYRLMQDVTFLQTRWAVHIDEDSKKNFSLIAAQLETVISQYRKFKTTDPLPEEVQAVDHAILRVNTLLSSEIGKYESRADA